MTSDTATAVPRNDRFAVHPPKPGVSVALFRGADRSTSSSAVEVRAHKSRGGSGTARERNSSRKARYSSAIVRQSAQPSRCLASQVESAGWSSVSIASEASIRARSWRSSESREARLTRLIARPRSNRRGGSAWCGADRQHCSGLRIWHRERPRAPSLRDARRRGHDGGFRGPWSAMLAPPRG